MSSETDLIDLISRHAGGVSAQANLRLGIGDDAAIIRVSAGHDLVSCTDTLVAGIHFPEQTSAYDIGWKSLAVNLSDLAAMGASPRFAQLSLTLPQADPGWVHEFMRGWHDLASQYQLVLIGGDTCHGPLSITVQALGEVSQKKTGVLLRGHAQAGDLLCVSGSLGGAAYALAELNRGVKVAALDLLNRPSPRIDLGLRLAGLATSAIDLSDGLAADLPRLLAGSGCGARVEVEQIPLHSGFGKLAQTQQYSLAISGGDDYELLFTLPPGQQAHLAEISRKLDLALTVIARINEQGTVKFMHANGTGFTSELATFEHFS